MRGSFVCDAIQLHPSGSHSFETDLHMDVFVSHNQFLALFLNMTRSLLDDTSHIGRVATSVGM
jgi:hypothetical protein